MAEPVALVALIIDAVFGWPRALYALIGHPVGGFARLIGACEARWNRAERSDRARRLLGILTMLLLIVVVAGSAWALQRGAYMLAGRWGWLVVALMAAPAFAQRSLHDHVVPVAAALEAGDLAGARTAVGMIVGRDTGGLDEAGVSRAAIESLSESFCDGIVAPGFWLLLLGLPGIWAYKAINTADSMIGHRELRWRAFGWAAARLDDVANLVPARLSGLLLCMGGGGGIGIMWRDARKHASPNAGWPEAAMAGVLGVRLAGPVAYDGVLVEKPWIGDGCATAGAADIRNALGVYRRACLGFWMIAVVWPWAR